MIKKTLKSWHQLLNDQDPKALYSLLHENAVFHSPVVHTPQKGRDLTHMYLMSAFHVLAGEEFTYLREVVDGQNAVLEFQTVVDGIVINGVDMITCDEQGLITDFKVMVRPLKAINLLHQKMMEMLEQYQSAS
ncbi:nuclear transport factor 2 family protein [Sneathiella glossodoripedis]|uniref:nuclear transport factor 2 family protein n=1 Tax=Sneathiella glossodoripedis TaxID=418853 RepID=UPI00047112AE|nr:nuclear transport factor 2 family protein [Sneathiella glossodoripedis]